MKITCPKPVAVVALNSSGVTVVVAIPEVGIPSISHWGASIPGLGADEAFALVDAGVNRPGPNEADVPLRVAIMPEHASGWTGRPGLRGSRDGRDWSTSFAHSEVTVDGVPVVGFASRGAGTLVVETVDPEARLHLCVVIELLESGLLRSRATLTNQGSSPYAVDDLVLAYPVPAESAELLDFAGRWGKERAVQRQPFQVGTHARENRKGRTGADSAYVLHAGTPGFGFAHGEIHAVHVAFSGNHTHYADRVFTGHRVLGGGELLQPGEVVLTGGASYTTPWLYGSFGRGLDEVAHRFHRHLRSRPRRVCPERPVTLNVWEAVYFDHDLDRLSGLADRAAAVGVERFVLDDGWFGARRSDRAGLGDWVVSKDVWPQGLHPLVEHVSRLGMEFGLWFEPEMVNPDSEVARAHPEWMMSSRAELPIESRAQQVLNLGVSDAYEHVKSQIVAVLSEYDIKYIKWDHNRDLIEAGSRTDGGRPAIHRQTYAFYRLLDELREAFPHIEIESCSSGGARVDLSVLERADRVWVSDNIDPLDRQHMLRWTTQLIPPEYMGSHIASGISHTTGRRHDLAFRALTAIFGHLGIEWDLAKATPTEIAELSAWVRFYKANRDLLMAGDLVRMDSYDPNMFVHGVVAPSQERAIFAVVCLGGLDAVPGPRLRFRGLKADASYRIRPIIIGSPPPGLLAPYWWTKERDDATTVVVGGHQQIDTTRAFPGETLSGASLEHIGVAAPVLHPEQGILFEIIEADSCPQ